MRSSDLDSAWTHGVDFDPGVHGRTDGDTQLYHQLFDCRVAVPLYGKPEDVDRQLQHSIYH